MDECCHRFSADKLLETCSCVQCVNCRRITLNGGPAGRAGWRAVIPIEKHEFSADWRAAEQGGLESCEKRRAQVNVQPADPPFSTAAGSPKILVFQLETGPSSPPGPPALRLVSSLLARDDYYPVFRLDIRQDSEFATGYGYPKTAIKREPDTDPDIRNALFDISRIQIFGKSCILLNHSFIIINQKDLFSLLCHDSESA